MVRLPLGGTQNFLGGTRLANKKIKQPLAILLYLGIVYLVPVTEKGYLECLVGKKG